MVVFKELRNPGQSEEFYRQAAGRCIFVAARTRKSCSGRSLKVEAFDELLGDTVELDVWTWWSWPPAWSRSQPGRHVKEKEKKEEPQKPSEALPCLWMSSKLRNA